METYCLRQAKLRVRFPAPHPFFLLLLFLFVLNLLFVSANAVDPGEVDYYAAAPDTLASALFDTRQTLFGVGFNYDGSRVTNIGQFDFTNRADGVQELATELYDLALGISQVTVSNTSALDTIISYLYSIKLGTDSVEGKLQNLYQQFDKLFELTDQRFESYWSRFFPASGIPPYFVFFDTWDSITGGSYWDFPNMLRALNQNLFFGFHANGYGLNEYGGVSDVGQPLARVVLVGFKGLAHLLLGDESHDILGLGDDGFDMTGQRGGWSLADISANGFRGLATLIAGVDNARQNHVWLGEDGFELNEGGSLMQMVGDGFLGMSALIAGFDRQKGAPLLSWIATSPDDGTTSTVLESDSLFNFLGVFATQVQGPLARLAYVLADKDDIALKAQEQPNMDAVKDDFFGDGQAAVKPSDIKDAAGVSSGLSDLLSGAGSPGDVFIVSGDSDSWSFFTEDVYNEIHGVSVPSSRDLDDFYRYFFLGDDGVYHIRPGVFDVDVYLEEASS